MKKNVNVRTFNFQLTLIIIFLFIITNLFSQANSVNAQSAPPEGWNGSVPPDGDLGGRMGRMSGAGMLNSTYIDDTGDVESPVIDGQVENSWLYTSSVSLSFPSGKSMSVKSFYDDSYVYFLLSTEFYTHSNFECISLYISGDVAMGPSQDESSTNSFDSMTLRDAPQNRTSILNSFDALDMKRITISDLREESQYSHISDYVEEVDEDGNVSYDQHNIILNELTGSSSLGGGDVDCYRYYEVRIALETDDDSSNVNLATTYSINFLIELNTTTSNGEIAQLSGVIGAANTENLFRQNIEVLEESNVGLYVLFSIIGFISVFSVQILRKYKKVHLNDKKIMEIISEVNSYWDENISDEIVLSEEDKREIKSEEDSFMKDLKEEKQKLDSIFKDYLEDGYQVEKEEEFDRKSLMKKYSTKKTDKNDGLGKSLEEKEEEDFLKWLSSDDEDFL